LTLPVYYRKASEGPKRGITRMTPIAKLPKRNRRKQQKKP
jgi:hypothetical protein